MENNMAIAKDIYIKNFKSFLDIYQQDSDDFHNHRTIFCIIKMLYPKIVIPTLGFHYLYNDQDTMFNIVLFGFVILAGVIAYKIPKHLYLKQVNKLIEDYQEHILDIHPDDIVSMSKAYGIDSYRLKAITFQDLLAISGPIHITKDDMTKKERKVYLAIIRELQSTSNVVQ